MARRHRILFEGAVYHVMARGNRKEQIFVDDVDRNRFLRIIAVGTEKLGAECYGYCLMGNHYHLVMRTPRANIPSVMQHIDGLYTQYENWRHRTTGHVFEARYTAILVDDTAYLRNALSYIFRNPVSAGFVKDPAQWRWSSYRATMGLAAPQKFVTVKWLRTLFEASTLDESRKLLAEHVSKEPEGYADLVRGVAEGPHEFKKRIRKVIGATLYRAELPRSYRAMARPSLRELFTSGTRADRREAILRAHVVHGYLLVEIARYLKLHPTTISRIVNESGSYRLTRD
jgi:putative transposase